MTKKFTFIPLMAAIMSLGALNMVPNKAERVSAESARNSRYFLLDESGTYGLKPGTLNHSIDCYTSAGEKDTLSVPLYVESIDQNLFYISMVDNGTKYYAKVSTDTNTYLRDDIEQAATWSRHDAGNGKFEIHAESPYTKYLGFRNKYGAQSFVVNGSKTSDNNYTLTLLPVDDHPLVQSLINAIKNVDCSQHNPDKEKDWDPVGEALDAITDTPILNYLKVAPADKNMSSSTLEWALAKYDYVCGKYKDSRGFTDFLQRNPSYPTDGVSNPVTDNGTNSYLTAVVTVVALITIASVTSVLFFKRKRK